MRQFERECHSAPLSRLLLNPSSSRPREEEPFLSSEMGRPLEATRACETQVSAERLAHPVHEPVSAAWREAILPPGVEHVYAGVCAVDPRFDPADEAVPENERQHVPAPTALGRWHEELPHVVEVEQASKEAAVPDQRIERGKECDGGGRLRWRFQQFDVLLDHEALAANTVDVDRNELAALDELVAQHRSARMLRPPRVRLRRTEPAKDVSAAADTKEAMRAVPREELVSELLRQRDRRCEQLVR